MRNPPPPAPETLPPVAPLVNAVSYSASIRPVLIPGAVCCFATQERFVYRHKWEVGDVLIWDNRCTLHTGTRFDVTKYERHVHRTWVKGDRPV